MQEQYCNFGARESPKKSVIPKSLDWYPKEFRAGDTDGKINKSLLGKSNLTPLEILIRETAQNSWDARLKDSIPSYSISLRTINGDALRLSEIFPITDQDTNFSSVLSRRQLQAIEISDRNTVGLDGPVDMAPHGNDSLSKNFEDLIYKVGVPRQDGKGGGTYGFGKTATYSFSEIGTVAFWTRCYNEDGKLEDRFIVSAFREQYVDNDRQYTGRHWWGTKHNNHIFPLQGEAARELGEYLFETRFEDQQTGTSLLIFAPRLESVIPIKDDDSGDDEESSREIQADSVTVAEQFTISAREAIRHHLWPKLVRYPGSSVFPMNLSLYVYSQRIELLDQSGDHMLDLWGEALSAVRNAPNRVGQKPILNSSIISSQVLEVTRNREIIGYLGIAIAPANLENSDILNPSRSIRPRIKRLALMREQTELIVAHVDWFSTQDEGTLDWVAVYRSVASKDHLYAESEPPTHDSWNFQGEQNEVQVLVRHTKRKVTQLLNDILCPATPLPSTSQSNFTKTAAVAKRFSKLLPISPNKGSESKPIYCKGNPPNILKQPKPVVLTTTHSEYEGVLPSSKGSKNLLQVNKAHFSLEGTTDRACVSLSVSIMGEDSTTEPVKSEMLQPCWENPVSIHGPHHDKAVFSVPGNYSVTFLAPPRVALRVNLSVKEER